MAQLSTVAEAGHAPTNNHTNKYGDLCFTLQVDSNEKNGHAAGRENLPQVINVDFDPADDIKKAPTQKKVAGASQVKKQVMTDAIPHCSCSTLLGQRLLECVLC